MVLWRSRLIVWKLQISLVSVIEVQDMNDFECAWSIFIPHLLEPMGPAEILLIADGLQTLDMLHSSTGNFLLIVDGLHTFDVSSRRSA
ncbi:hypothetical protein TNCV_2105831 [Trichonephila clavipes]|nr:hypothetical protein TNCV_2105831 [Trichonephila clavipes]